MTKAKTCKSCKRCVKGCSPCACCGVCEHCGLKTLPVTITAPPTYVPVHVYYPPVIIQPDTVPNWPHYEITCGTTTQGIVARNYNNACAGAIPTGFVGTFTTGPVS